MIDQLIIENVKSYDDFSASVRDRKINAPKKKIIKETVPFSNQTYDFSGINGKIYWEERTLEYVLEMVEMTPEELEERKISLKKWLMNVIDGKLYDPFIKDYHFIATFSDIDFEDEVEKTTVTVTFTAYPYMIANEKKVYETSISTSGKVSLDVVNASSHRLTPTIISDITVTFQIGGTTYSMAASEVTDDSIKLESGTNTIIVQPAEASGTFKVEFYEEVF